MIMKLLRLGRRKIHTIISRETIKPSSPTPCHLQTYNLSLLDATGRNAYVPLILFYPNNGICSLTSHEKAREMKKSLSQSLTRYYPLAGKLHTPTTPYVDCNDDGVVFVEAKSDSQLDTFQYMSEQDETLDQLFADGMVCYNSPRNKGIVGIQLNHFACGGFGVAVSMSHTIGDGCTLGSFVSHWASVARYGSIDHNEVLPLNPHFIHHPRINFVRPQVQVINQGYGNRVTRKFLFPNSKLSDLKNTVIINNPTRVEVLTSLLYKTAVAATTAKSGSFKPSYLILPVDIRKLFVQKLPQTTLGNYFTHMMLTTRDASETSLSLLVAEIKKEKVKLERVQSLQQAVEKSDTLLTKLRNEDLERTYSCSSLCGFPYNKVDFGWGKPSGATIAYRAIESTGFVLMDTPDGDGIEALAILEKEDMEIFANDKEMLSYCQI